MRRLISILMAVLVTATVFATGVREPKIGAVTITALTSGDSGKLATLGYRTRFEYASARLAEDFPQAKVEWLIVDTTEGSAITMDALINSGQAPNLYRDTIVRASKYVVPEYALPLDDLIRDLDKYDASQLDPYRRGGALLGLPNPGGAQAMAVNLEIMDDIGYTVPDNWTIDDFLEMAELVKQKYGGTKWATGMFAANQSGDYLINNWFASFGVDYYQNGDYTKSTIEATGGAKVYEFFQALARNGYIPPDAATLTDDDYVLQWARGDLAATAWFENWSKPYADTVISQGVRKTPVRYEFHPFPRAPGVDKVPGYTTPSVIVLHGGTREQNIVAGRLAEYMNDATSQTAALLDEQQTPVRLDITAASTNPRVNEALAIVAANGRYDFGDTTALYTPRRGVHYPILQDVLNGKITPAEAAKRYTEGLNAIQ